MHRSKIKSFLKNAKVYSFIKIYDGKEAGTALFAGRTFGLSNIEKWLVWLVVHPRTRVTSRNTKLSQPTKSKNIMAAALHCEFDIWRIQIFSNIFHSMNLLSNIWTLLFNSAFNSSPNPTTNSLFSIVMIVDYWCNSVDNQVVPNIWKKVKLKSILLWNIFYLKQFTSKKMGQRLSFSKILNFQNSLRAFLYPISYGALLWVLPWTLNLADLQCCR